MPGYSLPTTPPPTPRRRLALFGGSFDPIHAGHLQVARLARRAFDLDRVVLVPAAKPPHKPGVRLAPDGDRMAMAELVAAREPWLAVSDLELRRAGPSYTYDTLLGLAEAVGEPAACDLWFVIGADNLPGLPGWHRAAELLQLARPIVVWRGHTAPALPAAVRARLEPAAADRLEAGLVHSDHPASATAIRRALSMGETPEHLLPEVRDYLAARDLYGPAC